MEDEVVVASYNMSFMSDENTPIEKAQFASEATFLSSNPKISDPVHRRDYWKNALLLLEKFIEEQKHTCVIGLQEMNKTIKGSNTGSDAVDNMLHNLNKKLNTSYKQFCDTITNKGNLIALSIIYDTSRMGNPKENDGKETVIWDNDEYKGRPAMLVVTDKNNVFITIHGAQAPDLGRNKTEFNQVIVAENKNKVEDTVQSILKNFDLGSSEEQQLPNNIFLMGDLNDRYDEIKEFVILNERLHYSGDAPKSCCHNWDSSCSDDRYLKEYSEKYTNDSSNKKKKKRKTCIV